jgi:tetratricopeptide (TPR) repeat protein
MVFLIAHRSPPALNNSGYILVADFLNKTSDQFFDHSLTEAMRVSLRQSSYLNIFPQDRVADALQRMRLSSDKVLDDTTALSLARREGVELIVAGDIGRIGTTYVLSCRIINALSGESVGLRHREVSAVEKVLSEMDEICKDIRERLGESVSQISGSAKRLEDVTTSSLPALDLYSRGSALEGQGNFREARGLLAQAVEIDSLFAMAVNELAYIEHKLGNDSLALVYHRRLPPLFDRVTDREKFFIQTIYYGPDFEYDSAKAYENVRRLIIRYPNSADGLLELGWLAMCYGDTREALEASENGLRIDSTYAGIIYSNMGFTLALSGDANGAMGYYRKSKRIRPTYYTLDMYMSQAHWMNESLDSAEYALRTIIPLADGQTRIGALSRLASLLYFEGRIDESRKQCTAGVNLAQSIHRKGDESYFHYMLAEIAAESDGWREYIGEMKTAERLSATPFPELPLIGVSYAETGRSSDAERIIYRISSTRSAEPYFLKRQQDYLHLVKAELLLGEHQALKAMNEFQRVEKVLARDPFYLLSQRGSARSEEMLSDTSAIGTYLGILAHRGAVVMAGMDRAHNSGLWVSRLWTEVNFALARLYMKAGRFRDAEEQLHECTQIWQHADPGFRKAEEARQLLSQLTKGR